MPNYFDDGFPMQMEREFGMPPNVPPVAVAFGMHPMIDSAKSKEMGHECYKDVEFVKIAVPGDKTSLYFQPAKQRCRQRFPQAYAAFKARQGGEHIEGMRIEHWPAISKSMVLTLKVMHIHTVEALAATHDGHIDRIGTNGRELRDKAKAWLDAAKDGAITMRLAAEKKAADDRADAAVARMEAMEARMQALMASQGAPVDAPQPVTPRARRTA